MIIKLFIDNNAWDVFFDAKIDLINELPADEFTLQITREAEFEIPLMPIEKRQYVEAVINSGNIKTDTYFGWYDETLPAEEQRVGGWGELNDPDAGGRFIEIAESELIQSESKIIGPGKRPTRLYNNEADVSLAARSLHSVVLTCDGKKALKRARDVHGGIVIDLKKYKKSTNLADFIKSELERFHIKND